MKFIIFRTSGDPIDYPGLEWIEAYRIEEVDPFRFKKSWSPDKGYYEVPYAERWEEFTKVGNYHEIVSSREWIRTVPIWRYKIELDSLESLTNLVDTLGDVIVIATIGEFTLEVYDDHHS